MTTVDSLVADYLDRLGQVAGTLPPDRRVELLESISDHIDAARAAGAADDEAAVRTVLDRLGAPEEIVAAAREDAPHSPTLVARRRGTGLELAAVLMLTVGSLFPVVGWLVGVGLLWASPRWRAWEKLMGTLVVPLGPGAAILAGGLVPFSVVSEVCTGSSDGSVTCVGDSGPPGWVGPLVLAMVLIAPILVAVWLFRTATRRAEAEPPELVPAYGAVRTSPWGALEVSGVLVLGLSGLLVPVVGPLVGFVLVCCSPRWTLTHRAVAGALAVLPLAALTTALVLPSLEDDVPFRTVGVLLGYLLGLLGPGLAAVYLTLILQRRH